MDHGPPWPTIAAAVVYDDSLVRNGDEVRFKITYYDPALVMNKLVQLNKLKWDTARYMTVYIFRKTMIEIIICNEVQYTEKKKLIILN